MKTLIICMLLIFKFHSILNKGYKYQEDSVDNLLWPMPNNITKGNSTVYLNKNCKFIFVPSLKIKNNSEFYQITNLYDKIIHKNNDLHSKSFHNHPMTPDCIISVNIKITQKNLYKYNSNYDTNYESYSLNLSSNNNEDPKIEISVFCFNGLIRALETLSQIVHFEKANRRYALYNMPLQIYDKPNLAYRGLMIDTGRHFIRINKIKEIINGMMYNKLNILHWHLTDDELFTYESDILNQTNFLYSDLVYTKSQISNIIQYAFIRGVTVIPEIDTPSHSKSWRCLNTQNETIVVSKPEYGTLDPSKNKTYETVNTVLSEVIENFDSEYIHLGGDEVASEMWSSDEIKNFMKEKI